MSTLTVDTLAESACAVYLAHAAVREARDARDVADYAVKVADARHREAVAVFDAIRNGR